MASDNEITLLLNGPLLNFKNEPFKDFDQFTAEERQNTSIENLAKIAPPSKLGSIISQFITNAITPKDTTEAANYHRWGSKLHNKMLTVEGSLSLDQKELKELIDIFRNNKINVQNSVILGALMVHLESKEIELNQKLNSSK